MCVTPASGSFKGAVSLSLSGTLFTLLPATVTST
jgi:hypothetical protein